MVYALELRREGKSYQEIADRCGLNSEHRAQALVSKSIKRVLRETAEEVRSVELSRLEVLITCLWDKALKDAKNDDYRAFDRLRLLVGDKLKWCGAQAVLDGDPKDNRVTINVVSYTNTQVNERPADVPDSRLTLQTSPLLVAEKEDHEHSST
jgi:hypothetical protein